MTPARTLHLSTPRQHGPDVKAAQQLLIRRGYLPTGSDDGEFGPQTAHACAVAKEALGYPDKEIRPTCGTKLLGYLRGEELPPTYAARAAERAARPKLVAPIPKQHAKGIVGGRQGHVTPNERPPIHDTAGLDGYPAIDFIADAGAPVVAPEPGKVHRFSGHDPAQGPVSGIHGPFGWSLYLLGESGTDYYMTHLGSRTCQVGDTVKQGQKLAAVGDYERWGGLNHTHIGVSGGTVTIEALGNATPELIRA